MSKQNFIGRQDENKQGGGSLYQKCYKICHGTESGKRKTENFRKLIHEEKLQKFVQ